MPVPSLTFLHPLGLKMSLSGNGKVGVRCVANIESRQKESFVTISTRIGGRGSHVLVYGVKVAIKHQT